MDLKKVKQKTALVLASFGGPRSLSEIQSFLTELLCDQEVVRTPLPGFLHKALFKKIAQKRVQKVRGDYQEIGGKSPIYEDIETVSKKLEEKLGLKVLVFHRYLPALHHEFIDQISHTHAEKLLIFPLFPQFSYSTSGSIAKWFKDFLPYEVVGKMSWIKSYYDQEPFTDLFTSRIKNYIQEHKINPRQLIMLFSAHGVPKKFITTGDSYQSECEKSYQKIANNFPDIQSMLVYQSKFGPGEWIRPYTIDTVNDIEKIAPNKIAVLFIPLAFTSDHIETLFEIEEEYMSVTKKKGYDTYRLPAFNTQDDWVDVIIELLDQCSQTTNSTLLRK